MRPSEPSEDTPATWDVFQRRSELEKSRRTLCELVERMDRFVSSEASSLKGLFVPKMDLYRLKLSETSLKLLELDPSGWGLKASEILWHKAFHSTLKYAFKKEGSLSDEERPWILALIWRAICHYQGVIETFGLQDRKGGRTLLHTSSFSDENKGNDRKPLNEDWSRSLHVKCLLYLGDLSRYCRDMCPSNGDHYVKISGGYYSEALLSSNYKAGMPFNQLGRLSENELWGLPSAYFYLRSALSEDAFPGAEGNLKNLLAHNERILSKAPLPEDPSDMEGFVRSLLRLSKTCLFNEESGKTSELSEEIQSVLQLFHAQIVKEGGLQSVKDGQVVMNAVAYLLAGSQFMESRKKPARLSLWRACLLALFSHCVFKLYRDLRMELFGSQEDEESSSEEEEEEEDQDDDEIPEDEEPKKDNILDRFRRRRNRYTSSSTDDSDSCPAFSNSSSCEDDEDLLTKGIGFMNDSSSEESESEDEDVVIQQSSVICSSKDLAKIMGSHNLTPSIRLLILWVMRTPEVTATEADQHSLMFWKRLDKLFTLVDFISNKRGKYIENEEVSALYRELSSRKAIPLNEDHFVRGLKLFSEHPGTQGLNWGEEDKKSTPQPLQAMDMGLLRVKELLAFRDWLAGIRKNSGGSPSSAPEEDKRHALMQSMAQLWLKQEVEDLEEKDAKMVSPYIIVDHLAMVKHLRTIKDVVAAKKFTVIIPNAVVQELDSMKRNNNWARTAIRWLEWQFKQGNPWLRAQKKYESTALEDISYPKRKDKEAWHYFEILECCNYFTRLGSTRTVTLLSPQDAQMDINPVELAKCIGIRIEHVKTFRHCMKRNKNRDG